MRRVRVVVPRDPLQRKTIRYIRWDGTLRLPQLTAALEAFAGEILRVTLAASDRAALCRELISGPFTISVRPANATEGMYLTVGQGERSYRVSVEASYHFDVGSAQVMTSSERIRLRRGHGLTVGRS